MADPQTNPQTEPRTPPQPDSQTNHRPNPPPQPPTPIPLKTHILPALHPHALTVLILPARDTPAADFIHDFFGSAGIRGPYHYTQGWGTRGDDRGEDGQDSRGLTLLERLPEVRWVVVEHPEEMARVVRDARVVNWYTGVVQMETFRGGKRGGVRVREVRAEKQRVEQWWDLPSTRNPHDDPGAQLAGLSFSVRALHALMASEISRLQASGRRQGHPECWGAERLVLFGMEQGAALALHAALTWPFNVDPSGPKPAYSKAIGGLVALNGWAPFPDSLDSARAYVAAWAGSLAPSESENLGVLEKVLGMRLPGLQVFVAANADAEVIRPHHSDDMADQLQHLGASVSGGWYPTGSDWLNEPHGVDDIATFLSTLIDKVRWGTVQESTLAEAARVEREGDEERERRYWSEEAKVVEMERQEEREWRAFVKERKRRERGEVERASRESLEGAGGEGEAVESVEEGSGGAGGSRGGARGSGRGGRGRGRGKGKGRVRGG